MKTLSFNAKKGVMKLIPNDRDDLWVLYNVVQRGDRVYAKSSREIKLVFEGARPTEGKRISMFLGIQVEKTIRNKARTAIDKMLAISSKGYIRDHMTLEKQYVARY